MWNISNYSEETVTEKARLVSFAATAEPLNSLAVAASSAGFVKAISPEGSSHINCPFCSLELSNILYAHCPLTLHRAFSPNCIFLKNNKLVNKTFLDSSNLTRDYEALHTLPYDNETAQVILARSPDVFGSISHGSVTADGTSRSETQNEPTSSFEQYCKINELRLILPDTHISHISKCPTALHLSGVTSELNRLKTFKNWPKKEGVFAKSLAASGFIHTDTGNGDTVKCVYCNVQINNWATSSVPVDERHMKSSPRCLFMRGSKSVTNIPDVVSPLLAKTTAADPHLSAQLGIVTETAKTPEFAVEARRKDTFLTWPTANHKLASEMIEHQLYYKGHGDVVCCFSCGIEMSGWSSIDNIWIRHARQAPHCQLVIQEKGADWVAAIIEEHGRYIPPQQEPTIITVTTRALRPRMDSPATQLVLRMTNPKYEREEIRSVLIQNIKYGKPDFNCTAKLVAAIMEKRKEQRELFRVQHEMDAAIPMPVVVCQPQQVRSVDAAEEVETLPNVDEGEEVPQPSLMEITPSLPTSVGPVVSVTAGNPIEIARSMKAQMMCKICLDNVTGIVFLPCGHLVCCADCAPAMVQCPICRQEVKGTVRAYFDKL